MGKRIFIFGSGEEWAALAGCLSMVCMKPEAYGLDDCVGHIGHSLKMHGNETGNMRITILCSCQPTAFSKLLELLYQLRFSLGWLGPVAIVARPDAIREIESADLFRMSRPDGGPVAQRCIGFPFYLSSLLSILSGLDGYGRFAWKHVQQGIQDKDLIRKAHQLGGQLACDLKAGHELAPAMTALRNLLRARSGALLKFIQYHVDLSMVDRSLSGKARHTQSGVIRKGSEELLRATERLPQL